MVTLDADELEWLMQELPKHSVDSVPVEEFCERREGPLDVLSDNGDGDEA